MKIFFITNHLPYPPTSGAPLQTYSLLWRLAQRHDVWLAAFASTDEEDSAAHLRRRCAGVVTAPLPPDGALARPALLLRFLLTGAPPDLRCYHSEELARKIKALASAVSFDVAFIDHTEMSPYRVVLPDSLRRRAVWGLHDIDWQKYRRIARLEPRLARRLRLSLHSLLLRWWKPRVAAQFSKITVVSEQDRDLLQRLNPRLPIELVPSGVDLTINRREPEHSGSAALIFVGNMGYRPNVDAVTFFCKEILPLVRQRVPDVELWIVGVHPGPEIEQLRSERVHVTGCVEDVRPYYRRSTACVLPLRAGGGARLKLLESMALGCPVVSTTIGCEGRAVNDGEHLLIADEAEHFAQQTLRLLTDRILRRQIIDNARRLVERLYGWEAIAERFESVLLEAAGERDAVVDPGALAAGSPEPWAARMTQARWRGGATAACGPIDQRLSGPDTHRDQDSWTSGSSH